MNIQVKAWKTICPHTIVYEAQNQTFIYKKIWLSKFKTKGDYVVFISNSSGLGLKFSSPIVLVFAVWHTCKFEWFMVTAVVFAFKHYSY